MTKQEIKKLLIWFYGNARNQGPPLPWRRLKQTQDPWHVLVSEVMLQQTTVATIAKRFTPFISQFPTPAAMALADAQTVVDAWAGMGYYRRAHNLHGAARLITHGWGGIWPTAEADIKKLPGVGDYTAAAIRAFAFHHHVLPRDGNITRLLSRFLKKHLDESSKQYLTNLAEIIFPSRHLPAGFIISDAVQALMDLANICCKVEQPSCHLCPLATGCLGQHHWRRYPKPKIKTAPPLYHGLVIIYQNQQGHYLLTRQPEKWARHIMAATPLSAHHAFLSGITSNDGLSGMIMARNNHNKKNIARTATKGATKGAPQPIAATSDHQPPPKAHRHRLYHGMLGFPLTPLTPFSPPTASDKRNSKTIITPPRPAKQNTPPYVIRKNAIRHLLTHRQLVLSLLFVPAETGPQLNHDADPIATIIGSHGDAQWVAPDQLPHLPLSSLMKKVVKEIMANGIAKADQQAQNASNHSNHIGRKNQQGNGPPTQRFMVSPR